MLCLWEYERRVKFHLVLALAVLTTWSAFSALISTSARLFSGRLCSNTTSSKQARPDRLARKCSSSELAPLVMTLVTLPT